MFNTLVGRLYFLSGLVVASFYLFIYLSFDYSRVIVKDELLKAAQLVSHQAVENQEHLVESTEAFLTSLASLPQIQNPDSELCREFVSNITPLFERYVNIGVPNKQGILTCNGTELSSPVNVNDREYISKAITEHRFTTSGLHYDRAIGAPAINFAYPVKIELSTEEIAGAAVAVVSLDWWSALLSSSKLPDQSVAYVLDSEGNALASFPDGVEFEQPSSFDSIWKGSDDVNRVFTKHQVLGSDGLVLLSFITGVAVDEPLSRVNNRYTFIVVVFSALVVVILLLMRVFFVGAIAKPLHKLSDLALRLGRNEIIGTVQPIGIKEMDDLQDSFVEMEKRKSEAERRIILQAQIDSLTGITNRDAFNRALTEVFKVNDGREEIAIVLIDLDNFKEINDTRGHEIGDEILKVTASRLINQLLTAKLLSRLGGDEFIFILEGDEAKEHDALALCDRVQNIIKQPILLEHGEVMLTASVGVSIYPHDGQDVRSILGAADQAMYHAKQSGRSTTRRFNKELKDDLIAKMELAQDLREAILNEEFYLLYQPILNKNGDVIKFEALIRWQHPTKGLVPPDQFITFAEESGQIIEVGHWVIQEAKRALKAIQEVHGKHVQISVNVSPVQLSQYQGEKGQLLEELLAGNSDEQGAQAQNGLVVEITENLLMNSDESTRNALLAFREQGVQVALDDFGTGYSSLAYIMNYDIDYLKIDQSFVQKLEDEKASQTLCEAIISMAHALGVAVIAEGVETQKQADLLLGYHCDYLQGFYFSRPIPLDQALRYKREK